MQYVQNCDEFAFQENHIFTLVSEYMHISDALFYVADLSMTHLKAQGNKEFLVEFYISSIFREFTQLDTKKNSTSKEREK